MSLEAWGDEGGDDYMTPEQALDAGWMMPDDVEELRDLFKHIDWPPDGEMTKHHAALILMENLLAPTLLTVGSPEHARLEWAKKKLSRDVLI